MRLPRIPRRASPIEEPRRWGRLARWAWRALACLAVLGACFVVGLLVVAYGINQPWLKRRVQDEMLADAQLALNADRRRDAPAAANWLHRALDRADDLRARAKGVSDKEELDVLCLSAELTVSMRQTLVEDLPKRIDAALAEMAARREPSLRSYERWLEIDGALVGPAGASSRPPPTPRDHSVASICTHRSSRLSLSRTE